VDQQAAGDRLPRVGARERRSGDEGVEAVERAGRAEDPDHVQVDVPAGRAVKLKNKIGMDPKISEANGRRIYHWSNSHLEREDSDKDKSTTSDS